MDIVFELYREWRSDFEGLRLNGQTGAEALIFFPQTIQNWQESIRENVFLTSYFLVLKEMGLLLDRIAKLPSKNNDEIEMMRNKVAWFYLAKMKDGTDMLIRRCSESGIRPNAVISQELMQFSQRIETYMP
jgi:hypothetical protein